MLRSSTYQYFLSLKSQLEDSGLKDIVFSMVKERKPRTVLSMAAAAIATNVLRVVDLRSY